MNRSWFHSLLMFIWLTVGYAVVHVVIAGWGITVFLAIVPSSVPIENLHITQDGEAIIGSYTDNYSNQSFRRLDGTPITDTRGLNSSFNNRYRELTLTPQGETNSWYRRINAFYDFQKPGTCWYCVAEPNRSKTAYFVGFDRHSRRNIGYLGVNGFSLQEPDIEHSFPISPSQYHVFYGVLSDANNLSPHQEAAEFGEGLESAFPVIPNAASDTVWILSQGTIYEIRLGLRTVRPLISGRPEMRLLTQNSVETGGQSRLALLIRTDTELLTVDPESGTTETLNLDPAPRNFSEKYYALKDGLRMIVYSENSQGKGRPQRQQILWLDSAGQIERRAEVKLLAYSNAMFADPSPALCVCVPTPLIAMGAWGLSPWVFAPDSPSPLTKFFSELKLWLIGSLLIGVVTGWTCRRREREVFGRSGWFWPILVGACGWFGWIGYICLRPLPARLPQGQWLPVRPEPVRPHGTEIFA